MQDWINNLFQDPQLLRMGHLQRLDDLNLGLGWLYYGLVRIARPETIVLIGSWRGFSPLVLAKGIKDNLEAGKVILDNSSFVGFRWLFSGNEIISFNSDPPIIFATPRSKSKTEPISVTRITAR